MREEYYPPDVIKQASENPRWNVVGGRLLRFLKPHYYECDSLRDYFENIDKIKSGRSVTIDGLWVDSILEHESKDPNIGYLRVRDLFQERMKFLASRRYSDRGSSGLDEQSWKVFRSLKINDDVEIRFQHLDFTIKPKFLAERPYYCQDLIGLYRDNDKNRDDEEIPTPVRTYTLDEILVPVIR